ncbi:Excitatory amino acid transporter 2 [Echinococcus granulosus]|uniref:Amino acid transporter n=1 Tax=Echinococcus granulosus TaxID=6210 RepID=W6V1F6_ECHGR|nr:Excitatory amino acid transporter 2 [Echinococcus granulosus]EUB64762.1 Excitatory amino acid transporter 2 [Echinococcus granulosus]
MPGHLASANTSITNQTFTSGTPPKTSDIFADMLYNLFPDNVLGIALFQSRTSYVAAILGSGNETVQRAIQKVDSVNMLVGLFEFLLCCCFSFTPFGVCSMIAGPIAGLRDLSGTFSQLGLFMVTVIAALVAHMTIIFIIYAAFARFNPFRLLPYCFRTWLISITTLAPKTLMKSRLLGAVICLRFHLWVVLIRCIDLSVVAIPDMYNASDTFGIDPKVSRFVVPLTAALKGDGSAAFLGASAIFIIQLTNTPITPAMIVIIILVILVTILASLGVAVNYVGLLFAIDWFMTSLPTFVVTESA